MHVRKLGERLFVELPAEVVERLGLKDGDDVLVGVADDGTIRVHEDDRRAAALARLKGLAWAAPQGSGSIGTRRMRDDVFLDTNILIYATQPNDPCFAVATATVSAGGIISVQVLNEFVYVARRKFKRPWAEIRLALSAMSDLLHEPRAITRGIHGSAIAIAERDGLSVYDALIVASALEAGCTTLLSEDMQDGRVIDGRLTIRNPFTAGLPMVRTPPQALR